MKKILITGGAGNVGASLAISLSENSSNNVYVVDNLVTGNINNLSSVINKINFVNCDVNNLEELTKVFLNNTFDYVFHYAALVGVKRTVENPFKVFKDIEGLKNILLLSKLNGVKKIFYSSSSEVYGEPYEIPQNEESTPLNSRLPYAIVKNLGESMLKSYQKEYGLNYTIFRFFNTYGPLQSVDFVIKKFILQSVKGDDITIFGSGNQTRTFCYIDDNINFTKLVLENNEFNNDIINVGNNIEISMLRLAEIVKKITNSKSKIVHMPALKEGDMTRRCPDNGKMMSLYEKKLISIEEGIERIYNGILNE
jgi:UDP-glucuronate decarboxylase